MTGDFRRAQIGSGTLHLNEDDDRRSYSNGSGGMHGNTKRTMVGGRFHRVDVRYLNHGQEQEQEQTDDRHQRQSAKLCVERAAEVTL